MKIDCDFERELDEPDSPQPELTLSDEDIQQVATLFAEVFRETFSAYGFKRPLNATALRVDRYRERLRAAQGSYTQAQWLARVLYYGWCCRYCGTELTTKTLVKEHAIPLSRGGTNLAANLVPACKPCNSAKKDKTPSEFRSHWRVMR